MTNGIVSIIMNKYKKEIDSNEIFQSHLISKTVKRKAGYIYLHSERKITGTLRSCLQDAAIIASKHVGVDMTKNYLYKRCDPRRTKDSTIKEVTEACKDKINFVHQTAKFTHVRKGGGKENQLIKCTDGKVRVVIASVENASETTQHAFIHVACAIKKNEYIFYKSSVYSNKSFPNHVSAVIDNRVNEPLCLIEESDIETVESSRSVLVIFFGGEGVKVWIKEIFMIQEIIQL